MDRSATVDAEAQQLLESEHDLIVLDVLLPDGSARLLVARRERGIGPGEQPHRLERSHRAKGSEGGGAAAGGIGLAVVRWLVESHAGRSERLDEEGPGSVFAVTLPLAAARPELPRFPGSELA